MSLSERFKSIFICENQKESEFEMINTEIHISERKYIDTCGYTVVTRVCLLGLIKYLI